MRRAEQALSAASAGKTVAVVSGGDPGVFGMAAAICEALEHGPAHWREVDIRVVPGISAMLAVAARVGAPLGHDFCALSLSDNLKPWTVVERRLEAAAAAGFVIALYNPISRARPWQLERAFAKLGSVLPGTTPVVFGRAVGREDERIAITPLSAAQGTHADMATCIIVGSAETRLIERRGSSPLVYTPRASPRPSA
jgi:precorrin-3B C17-methyltransferase